MKRPTMSIYPKFKKFNLLLKPLIAFGLICGLNFQITYAESTLRVVSSMKPIHSIVSYILQDVGESGLIMKGIASPHTYSLRPSDAEMLQDADVIFWVGETMETGLASAIEALPDNARVFTLSEAFGVQLKPFREEFAAHHDHEEEEHEEEHGHAEHAHGEMDMHLWLDPQNAVAIATYIATVLAQLDSKNSETYFTNAARFSADAFRLMESIEAKLDQVNEETFIVYHDGYLYFEERFGLEPAAAIIDSSHRAPSVKRMLEIRETIGELEVKCAFTEPQFDEGLMNSVLEGTTVRRGILDPIGADLEVGPSLYFNLLENMGDSLFECLSANS